MKLKKVSLIIIVGLIIVSLVGCAEKVNNENTDNENTSKYKIERQENWATINDEILVYTTDSNKANIVLVKSGDEVALIDVGYDNEDALKVKEYIEENNLQVKYLIMTHLHSEQMKNYLTLKKLVKDGELIKQSNTENDQTISLGDKTLKILHTPGHLANKHISIEIDDEIFVAGDIVTTDETTQTCIIYDEFESSIETLEKLKDNKYSLIIPGHGDIFKGNTIINETLNVVKEQFSKHEIKKEGKSWIVDNEILVRTGKYEKVNSTLVVSGNEATLIDTGYEVEEAGVIKKYIEDNNLTLKNIIITHRHPDHLTQLDVFDNDNVNYYEYDNSEDNQVIEMGDKKMKIIFTPGHFKDKHMSVEINEKILVAGDIITSSINPIKVLEFGGNRETLINTLEGLKEKDYSLIVPGHGEICIGESIIDDHLQILKKSK